VGAIKRTPTLFGGMGLAVFFLGLSIFFPRPISAQTISAPCGVVDGIDYPIDISDSLGTRYDDFALFRNRFGGNHVGIDIGFNRWGETVDAAARGEITYSDPEGWDTEKGVVIVRHVFPDNTIAYTLYGHMEQTDTLKFPPVGVCVERGDPVGAIGWPSRGLPHLHYEIRNFLPDDGGPGYTTNNPLREGWFHPLDFTLLWRLRLDGGYLTSLSFANTPALPPVLLDTNEVVIANGSTVESYGADGVLRWSVTMPGVITGISGLSGGRVIAYARGGQAVTLQTGRYLAVWQVAGLVDTPFVMLGEMILFATVGGGVAAHSPDGALLWSFAGVGTRDNRALDFSVGASQVALTVRTDEGEIQWRALDGTGRVMSEGRFTGVPAVTPTNAGWLVLAGSDLMSFTPGGADGRDQMTQITAISPAPGRNAKITSDAAGNAYIFLNNTDSTLLSVSPAGALRWRTTYPLAGAPLPPVLRADQGCVLYALDMDGMFRVLNAADGTVMTQRQLYAGGVRNGSPPARMVRIEAGNRLLVSAGFLSLYLLDGTALAGSALGECNAG